METNNGTYLRLLHISDVHLEAPFAGLPAEQSEERRRELRNTFIRIMQYVRERAIQIVLISGDLFDLQYVTNATAEVLIREFRGCPETVFILAPGKQDVYQNNPIYQSGRLPSNCYVFSKDTLSRFDFDNLNVTVYGWAFLTDSITVSPLYGKTVDDPSRINILCGYADLDGEVDSTGCPISENDLRSFGADYYALGSRHTAGDFVRLDGSVYSYCGAPECIGFEDTGMGGANLVVFDLKNEQLAIDSKRLSFGKVKFVNAIMDVTGVNTTNEIINRISRLISEKKYGMETALRVELVGNVDPAFLIPRTLRSEAFGLYFFDIFDKTLPLYGTAHFEKEMTTAGEVFRKMQPLMQSDDEDTRLLAAKAFRVALAALEGRDADL